MEPGGFFAWSNELAPGAVSALGVKTRGHSFARRKDIPAMVPRFGPRALAIVCLAVLLLFAGRVRGGEDAPPETVVTASAVLDMMRLIPLECSLWGSAPRPRCPTDRPAGFELGPDAGAIAAAIARHAASRYDAALLAVFSSYESGNDAHAVGDGGKSFGAFQVQGMGEGAFDPDKAAARWLELARSGQHRCHRNPPDEQLASVASGNCDHGREKVRRRVRLARSLALLPEGQGE